MDFGGDIDRAYQGLRGTSVVFEIPGNNDLEPYSETIDKEFSNRLHEMTAAELRALHEMLKQEIKRKESLA